MKTPFQEKCNTLGRVESITTSLTGRALLAYPKLNKGSAFSIAERKALGLLGKLPAHVETMSDQVARCYAQFCDRPTPLAKNIYLNELKQHNETLFYALAMEHIAEMLPIVYTPTIGDAVEKFSYAFNTPQGLYFSYPYRDNIKNILKNRYVEDIELIIVTDGEGVLGIGDWGVGGMDICIGKLMVYTLCGGINPRRVLPIQLDVGTNNEALLKDPMYLGWRHPRITGADYDAFIDDVVNAIQTELPNCFLHWEDFGRSNARRNLNRFRDKLCTFNDDIQGTGATALASVLSALAATEQALVDQNIVFLGAGTAGVGIADQICHTMVHDGLSPEDARKHFWLVDRQGLLIDDMPDLVDFQKPYARPRAEMKGWHCEDPNNITLLDVIRNVKPSVLIGCSTVHGAFNETVVKTMANQVEHPMIFPLSNPTALSEATPQDLYTWTNGRVLTATGSPFEPITWQNKPIRIAQCNNAFIFPGLGLGIIASEATHVTDGMIAAAAYALAACSPAIEDRHAALLPDFDTVHTVSQKIAYAVGQQAQKEGVSNLPASVDLKDKIESIFWAPEYVPYDAS